MAVTMTAGAESHSTDPYVGAEAAADRKAGIVLPWVATEVTVISEAGKNGSCAARVYVSLNSTVATTSDWPLGAGEAQVFVLPVNKIGLASTTTSTGVQVRIGAWRY